MSDASWEARWLVEMLVDSESLERGQVLRVLTLIMPVWAWGMTRSGGGG